MVLSTTATFVVQVTGRERRVTVGSSTLAAAMEEAFYGATVGSLYHSTARRGNGVPLGPGIVIVTGRLFVTGRLRQATVGSSTLEELPPEETAAAAVLLFAVSFVLQNSS